MNLGHEQRPEDSRDFNSEMSYSNLKLELLADLRQQKEHLIYIMPGILQHNHA